MGSQEMENQTFQLKPLEKIHLKEMVLLDSICFSKEDAYSFEIMNYFFSSTHSFSIGYFFENKLIAFILCVKNEIVTIDVHPKFQNKGLGTNLLKYAIFKIKKKGYENVSLEVDKDNTKALKLYKKFGFEIVEKYRENYKSRYYMLLKLKK